MDGAAPEVLLFSSTSAPSERRHLQFLLLTIAAAAALYARSTVNALQETMRIALTLTDNQTALLQGLAPALTSVIAATPVGLIVDRYSRVRLLVILGLFSIGGIALTAVAPNFTMLFIARCLSGFTYAATSIAAFSLVADWYAPAERGRASMVIVVGQWGGMAAAFAIGGALVDISGSGPNAWRWAMLWMAAPLFPIILLTLLMREPGRINFSVKTPSPQESLVKLWRYRPVVGPLLMGMIMAETGSCAVLVWAAPMLSRNFTLSPDRVGGIMSVIVLVGTVLGSIAGGVLADRCQQAGGPRRTMSIMSGLALLSAPAGLFVVLAQIDAASVFLATFLMFDSSIIVMAVTLVTIVVPSQLRGLCLATAIGANTLVGVALAPLIVSLLAGTMGGPPMIGRALALVCAASGFLGAALFAFGRRRFHNAFCIDAYPPPAPSICSQHTSEKA